MGVGTCPDCGYHPYSDSAEHCPRCGSHAKPSGVTKTKRTREKQEYVVVGKERVPCKYCLGHGVVIELVYDGWVRKQHITNIHEPFEWKTGNVNIAQFPQVCTDREKHLSKVISDEERKYKKEFGPVLRMLGAVSDALKPHTGYGQYAVFRTARMVTCNRCMGAGSVTEDKKGWVTVSEEYWG